MLCSLSSLDKDQLERIKSLEQELGKSLLSFTCHDIQAAKLNDEQLQKIRRLEDQLGVVLVAVQ